MTDAIVRVRGPIRQDAQEERGSFAIPDFIFKEDAFVQRPLDILQKVRPLQAVREMTDAASDVLRFDAEDTRKPRRVLANTQPPVEEQRTDVGTLEKMLHIAVQFAQFRNFPLKL